MRETVTMDEVRNPAGAARFRSYAELNDFLCISPTGAKTQPAWIPRLLRIEKLVVAEIGSRETGPAIQKHNAQASDR